MTTLFRNCKLIYSASIILSKCITYLISLNSSDNISSIHTFHSSDLCWFSYLILGITKLNKLCIFCGDDIEDEFHFVLKCKTFQGFRNYLIKPYCPKYKTICCLHKNVEIKFSTHDAFLE
jgi:hypothetical protein